MRKNLRTICFILSLLLISGCVTHHTVMTQEGKPDVNCDSWGFGIGGCIAANLWHDDCINLRKEMGYRVLLSLPTSSAQKTAAPPLEEPKKNFSNP